MTEPKFTPGPWKMVIEGSINLEEGLATIDAPNAGKSTGKSICRTYESFTNEGARENIANARLIAAAPEMYDACERAFLYIDSWGPLLPEGDAGKLYKALKNVLAKARGETNESERRNEMTDDLKTPARIAAEEIYKLLDYAVQAVVMTAIMSGAKRIPPCPELVPDIAAIIERHMKAKINELEQDRLNMLAALEAK